MNKKNIYNILYGKYNFKKNTGNRVNKILELLSNFTFEKILDIGCGDGEITLLIKKVVNAKDTYGLEIADEAVKISFSKGINCRKIDLDNEDFPFENNFFDFIFCGEIIEHLFYPDNLLRNIWRVLKNDGYLLITTPNIASWHARLSLLLGYNPIRCSVSVEKPYCGKIFHYPSKVGVEHIRYFTLKSLKEILVFNSFEIKKVLSFYEIIGENVNEMFRILINNTDKFFSFFPSLASSIGILAKKKNFC